MNPTKNHKVESLIPGLTQWVKDPALLWLWCKPVAVALIPPLAWELPYAPKCGPKRQTNKQTTPHTHMESPLCGEFVYFYWPFTSLFSLPSLQPLEFLPSPQVTHLDHRSTSGCTEEGLWVANLDKKMQAEWQTEMAHILSTEGHTEKSQDFDQSLFFFFFFFLRNILWHMEVSGPAVKSDLQPTPQPQQCWLHHRL